MKPTKDLKVLRDNRLVKIWYDPKSNEIFKQRKKLAPGATKFAKEIQSWYAKKGDLYAVDIIREILEVSLEEAYCMLNYLCDYPKDLEDEEINTYYQSMFGV